MDMHKVPDVDLRPGRCSLQIVCRNPSLSCSIKYLKYMVGFNYAESNTDDGHEITLTAWNDSDSRISQHLYGFASNICHACQQTARRQAAQKVK